MVHSCSIWILWLTCYCFMFTSSGFKVSFLTMLLMQDGLWCCLSLDLFDLEFFGFCFPPLQCMLPRKKALKLLSAKSLCWLQSPVAMLILVSMLMGSLCIFGLFLSPGYRLVEAVHWTEDKSNGCFSVES